MNEEQRAKIKELKEKNKQRALRKQLKENEFLQECIEYTKAKVFSIEESKEIADKIFREIPFTFYGKVDFDKVEYKKDVVNLYDIKEFVELTDKFYVMWMGAELPILKVRLEDVLEYIDDVTAVSFDTWLVSLDYNLVIEFYHEGEITLGIK